MHNKTIALTDAQKSVAAQVRSAITVGQTVEVNFVKRDHSTSSLTGNIVSIVGENDKEAMVLLTDKGHRSANLWAVTGLRVL